MGARIGCGEFKDVVANHVAEDSETIIQTLEFDWGGMVFNVCGYEHANRVLESMIVHRVWYYINLNQTNQVFEVTTQ